MIIDLDPPRWPGGPEICPIANLPAFKTVDSMKAFLNQTLGSALLQWKCPCGSWHCWTKTHAPAGETSGSAREEKIPQHVLSLPKV